MRRLIERMDSNASFLAMVAQDLIDEPNILAIEYSLNYPYTSIDHIARGLC
jgi:hypothetical protein